VEKTGLLKLRLLVIVSAAGLAAVGAGCQGTGGTVASGRSGPAATFGQNYVPPQSEPPVEESATIGAKTVTTAAGDESDGAVDRERKSRWLSGGKRESAPRKTIPVSTRTDAFADDLDQ